MTRARDARTAVEDWQERAHQARIDEDGSTEGPAVLSAPNSLEAVAGRGQVTLRWEGVEGAVGYLVHRSADADGPFVPIDHGGGDVQLIPEHAYADTTEGQGPDVWYAVAACSDVDVVGPLGASVRPTPGSGIGTVSVTVDASRRTALAQPWSVMVGSEHLSHMLSEDTTGGRPIGAGLTEALGIVHDELGIGLVRAHAILDDDLGTYRRVDGETVMDFSGIDRVYDLVRSLGLRPVVELSFTPGALAPPDPPVVFTYGAVISPPAPESAWAGLVVALVAHLIDRYGVEEVRRWPFEVWNEPNLGVFWDGTPEDYFRLYDVTAAAVRSVDDRLRIGGPASAAAGWIDAFLTHVARTGAPVDFVSTHTYGNAPVDLRAVLARHGREDAPILWTEWGPTPTHGNPVGDMVWAAPFLLRGMLSALDRVDALSHWVASDHFEELGRPPALAHGGFGLLTVGSLRKPNFRALELLGRLGPDRLACRLEGDGAESLVQVLAAAEEDRRVDVLVWNGTLEAARSRGLADLDRRVHIEVAGVSGRWRVEQHRIDREHSNVLGRWEAIRNGADWPDDDQWAELRAADRLDAFGPSTTVEASGGTVTLDVDLPMPAVAGFTLTRE